MTCAQEMCRNWSGSGCVCAVFGIEPAEVCEHGEDAASCLACDNEGHLGGEHMTRCPLCGATVRSISRESGGRWSLSCGDWITDQQAAPILAARGDDT